MSIRQRLNLDDAPRIGWWEKTGDDAARALYSQATALELAGYRRRYRDALLYRLVTGDDAPEVFGYWMSQRAASSAGGLSLANYREPEINVIASALEVFENRIGTLRPFVQILPNGGTFQVRESCSLAEHYTDALFDQVRLYEKTRLSFRDRGTWGTSFLKVTGNAEDKCVEIERVLRDEILIDAAAAVRGRPNNLIQRRYIARSEAYDLVDQAPSKERDGIAAAIRQAPPAFIGTFWAGQTPDPKIVLMEGWKLPTDSDDVGKNFLALPNKLISEDDWKRDHFPFAVARWQQESLGYWGGSCAFAMLPYQRTINKHVERTEANFDHQAYSGWIVDQGVQIKAEALGGRPGRVIRKNGSGNIEPIVPQSNAADALQAIEMWVQRAFLRVGLNQQQVAGLKQPGLTAAAALRTMVQIEDARNKGLQITSEQEVRDVAVLALEAADDINLSLDLPGVNGRTVAFADLKLKENARKISVFPINALVNDPEGRQQQIAELYADGNIDKRTKLRLMDMPDLQAFAQLQTAADDLVESQLDEIVRTGKYVAPEPFDDLTTAMTMARNRYWLEKRFAKYETKERARKVLRNLQCYMTAVSEMMTSGQQFIQPAPSAPQGMQPPAGAPAAPPMQSAPSIAPPAVPQAA
jgi:hypothetical protein